MKVTKHLTLIAIAWILISVSCSDDEVSPDEQLEKDIELIDSYLLENNITAEEHPTGLRYVIHQEGGGDQPSVNDNITINYRGYFMASGEEFDSGENVSFRLGNLIAGWQIGIPLIKVGGSITLYIPSGYAYGAADTRGIPGNSILVFDVDLLSIN